MNSLKAAAEDFLAQKRIAIAGVSRTGQNPANLIYRKLREAGHQVFALNPNTESVEGDPCFRDVRSIPGGVDGIVIATNARTTPKIVRECIDAGVPRIWMHRSFGEGSVDREAAELARRNGIEVIAGGCPMMFADPVDIGHKCMRWILGITGGLPDPVMPEVISTDRNTTIASASH
jgi:uncharacterized protein